MITFAGALIDDYVYIHYKELFPKEVYRVQEILEQDGFEYGARVTNRNMSTCFRRIRYTQTPVLEQLIDAVGNSKEKVEFMCEVKGVVSGADILTNCVKFAEDKYFLTIFSVVSCHTHKHVRTVERQININLAWCMCKCYLV